jgi:signal transduction histidine kinase/chemotaxis receptor (MCP) glutamine deamidase CheD
MTTTRIQTKRIHVETGKVAVAKAPMRLYCGALGSCVAVFIYDLKNQVGGVAHVMLPGASMYMRGDDPLKYAENAIEALIEGIASPANRGEAPSRLEAKIIGGAQVIKDEINIGAQNIQAVKQKLEKEGIPIVDSHIGGDKAIHVTFDIATGGMSYEDLNAIKRVEDFIVSTPELTPELTQRAYMNVLEDLQLEKENMENQRVATFNILEDITESQITLEKKYKQIDVIRALTQKLGKTLEVRAVMDVICDAFKKLYPSITIAYVIVPNNPTRAPNIIYINTQAEIGEMYVELTKANLIYSLTQTPSALIKKFHKQWVKQKFYREMVDMGQRSDTRVTPRSQVNVPLIVPGIFTSLLNISSTEANIFEDAEELQKIRTIIGSAAQTIERLNELINAEKSRLSDLVKSMTNGVVMFDVNREIIIANPMIRQISGYDSDKFKLGDFLELFQKAKIADKTLSNINIEEGVRKVLSQGIAITFKEVPFKNAIYEIFITPVRNEEKKVSGGAIIVHDITHVKAVDKMKTEFVSIASHQLRTPLTSINWNIELLLGGDAGQLTEEQKKFLQDVHDSSQRMAHLVSELLNVSRLETGRIKIEPNPAQLEDLIQEIIKEEDPLIKKKKCMVVFQKPKVKLPELNIDKSLVRQVIHNMITNAVKYSTDDKTCEITVMLVEKGSEYILSVEDEGIGIPKEAQDRIFEKMFRADNALEVATEGTGLGLYVAKMIMEASGGKMWFESKEGVGSTFYISFPVKGMKAQKGEKGLAQTKNN